MGDPLARRTVPMELVVTRAVVLSLVQLLSVAAVAAGVSMLVHVGAGLVVLGTAGLYASWQWDRAAGP